MIYVYIIIYIYNDSKAILFFVEYLLITYFPFFLLCWRSVCINIIYASKIYIFIYEIFISISLFLSSILLERALYIILYIRINTSKTHVFEVCEALIHTHEFCCLYCATLWCEAHRTWRPAIQAAFCYDQLS